MMTTPSFSLPAEVEVVAAGQLLRRRNEPITSVLHLDAGRVARGIWDEDHLRQQLGAVDGPCWLDAASVLVGTVSPVDMVTETRVQLRRMPREAFERDVQALPASARSLLLDMARGYRQQSELAVSRLAQDAESRCAQWLLSHAQPDQGGAMRVTLHQRKRMIAAQLGIAPETFSRVLRHLRELGLVDGTGNVLNLPQPRLLASMAGT